MQIKTPKIKIAKRELEKRAPKFFGMHSKKRPNNLVLGRTYDHHIYDLVEVGVENFKSQESFKYDKKLTPKIRSKPLFAFIGEEFETVDELKHLKEVLLDIFRGEEGFLIQSCAVIMPAYETFVKESIVYMKLR